MKLNKPSSPESRSALVENRLKHNSNSELRNAYSDVLLNIAKEADDSEIDDYVLEQFTEGLFESEIHMQYSTQANICTSPQSITAVCAVHNSESLVQPYIDHYMDIGVSDFVFIDNNSSDNTIQKIVQKSVAQKGIAVNIWQTADKFDGFKAMGWKQRMFHYYGLDRWYLNLDIDEHFVYEECENISIDEIATNQSLIGIHAIGALLLDMYPDADVAGKSPMKDGFSLRELRDHYTYFDRDTYVSVPNEKYIQRIFGGPRTRVFNRHPSLQKYPLAYIGQQALAINPHFWYPYSMNTSAQLRSALLHYKFLPGDIEKYREYVESGVHWDNSSQYRSYVDGIDDLGTVNFYDSQVSTKYLGSVSLRDIVIMSQ